MVIDINTEMGMYRDWTHPNKKELDDLRDDIEFDYDINKKGVSQYDFDRLTEFKEKLKSLKYKETV